jgi:quinoprotein glucose dehydrogenase
MSLWLRRIGIFTFGFATFTLLVHGNPDAPKSGYNPPLAKASDEAEKALGKFKRDPSLKVEVWAAEPYLAQPVAIALDEKGNCYVAETFRHSRGVTDNRGHMNWLDEELACRTVEDRVAMFKKDSKEKFTQTYEKEKDRIRFLQDTKGLGKADRSTIFADDFGKAEDGLGAGLLARDGEVFFTCVPSLWKLKDTKKTGTADVKESLSRGYGVHVAFIGHDLHGLRMGPDGRLYFSMGDRGFNVTSKEGKKIFYPDTGGVLRCELDGSNLEMFSYGLRNPQELAFDDYGNLFTVDNNSDSGDKARFVYIVPGMDSGWRIGYQYGSAMSDRGPWNAEKIWHPQRDDQPASIVPPIVNYADGPSGFTHYPGIGLSDQYKNHFFLCDFRGSAGNSGILSFTTKPKGASFELTNSKQFLWSILATDVDFGPDSAMYVSDWVEGWDLNGKGRIYKVSDPAAIKNPKVAEAKKLLAEGFKQRKVEELFSLLGHPHQQVRLEAQYALAGKATEKVKDVRVVDVLNGLFFAGIGGPGGGPSEEEWKFTRIHAIWTMGMIGRKHPELAGDVRKLANLLTMERLDDEYKAQIVFTLGDNGLITKSELPAILPLLKSSSSRVRSLTGLALSKVAKSDVSAMDAKAIFTMLKENDDQDPYLRHAGAMALSVLPTETLVKATGDESKAVRMGVLLALRKQGSAEVARFLLDTDPKVLTEATRAIHDEPIDAALPALANLISNPNIPLHATYRVLNANFRLGKEANAQSVAQFAARTDAPAELRELAIKMLGEWSKPGRRDFVTGLTQSIPERSAKIAQDAFQAVIARVFVGPAKVQQVATATAAKLGTSEVGPILTKMVADEKVEVQGRVDALQALASLKNPKLESTSQVALKSSAPQLRNAARSILAKQFGKSKEVITQLQQVLTGSDRIEQQGALQILKEMKSTDAEALIEGQIDLLLAGKIPGETQLDLLEAASVYGSKKILAGLRQIEAKKSKTDELAEYRVSLLGGDATNGKRLFFENQASYCQRCHKAQGMGGEVGPDLTGIGSKQNREYLLEAIVLPNKQIAKGFESIQVVTADGKTISGIVKQETAKELTLVTPEAKLITISKEDIEDRKVGRTGMPEDLVKKLSKRELRDLVEYLSSLKN